MLKSILSSDEMLSESTEFQGPAGTLFDYLQLEQEVSDMHVKHICDLLLTKALAPKVSREEKLKQLVEGLVTIKAFIETQDPKLVDLLERS